MKPRGKQRIDRLLVEKGLVDSREKAQALILEGLVLVDGQRIDKPGHGIAIDSHIELLGRFPYVSRAGKKLEAALDTFHVDVTAKVCLDIGASTGGFTDCLLQRGARKVYAVDVGKGQLDWKLRNDPRVVVREGLNARYLRFEEIGEYVDLTVCDVSFISATMILPVAAALLRDGGAMIVLVKPQFEVRRGQVGRRGIVRDPELHHAACRRVEEAARALGFQTALMESPILGAEGNKEYLLYAHH
jgi:23S rRNA (cytidine1920-2'-O)/16S rRNA (cytidine1409-2'-O)-methyltransferase